MSRASWGKAKLVVQALSSDIHSLDNEGCNLEEMYSRLKEEGKLTIGKSTFKRHASELLKTPKEQLPPPSSKSTAESWGTKPVTAPSTKTKPYDTQFAKPASSTPANSSRPGQTIIPGSSLKRGGFNDPEDPSVATEDLLDQYYGTANKSSDEKEPNE